MEDNDKENNKDWGGILRGIAAILSALLGTGGIAVFLNGGNDPSQLTQPPQAPQESSTEASTQAAGWLNSIVGSYQSNVWIGGSIVPGVTEFKLSTAGALTGFYELNREQDAVFAGTLSDCQALEVGKIQCQWNDKYGVGTFEVSFSNNFSSFYGYWTAEDLSETYSWEGSR